MLPFRKLVGPGGLVTAGGNWEPFGAAAGGSFTFAQDNAAGASGTATTIATSLTSVASDDLIAVRLGWTHLTATASLSDGTNTASSVSKVKDSNNTNGQWHYFLPGTHVTGSVTLTATFTVTSTFRSIMAFRITTTGTVALDQHNENTNTPASATSGNITTTVATSIAFGGVGDDNFATAPSAMQINGVAATANTAGPVITSINSWFRIVSSTFTGGASATVDAGEWVCEVINFKAS